MRSWFASALALTASAGAIVAAQELSAATRAWAQQPQQPIVLSRILVEGNQRIEARTVLSYLLVKPGDPFDQERYQRLVDLAAQAYAQMSPVDNPTLMARFAQEVGCSTRMPR